MSDDLGTPVSEPVSQKFNDLDAEIVFKSSDGILFRIHKLNLRACTEAFSPPENTTFDEIVALTETSSTLELLFRFIYPLPQPNFGELDFESLVLVAEAAEKYRVFPAMNLCTIYMEEHLINQDHVEAVFLHSLKHGLRKCVARAAPLLLDRPLDEMVQIIPSHFVIPWVRYHSHWTRVWKSALSSAAAEDMSQNCSDCQKNALTYLSSAQLSSLEKISTHLVPCEGCVSTLLPSDSDIKSLVSTLKNEMIWIPTFADFAFPDTAQPTEQELPESESTNPVQVQLVGQRAASTEDLDVSKITFLSSDGVSFVVVLASIQALSKNLLPSQYGETVPLPESSTTLRLLFEFLGISPPDLDGLNFDILGPLSLAADLYQIFPAISVCFIRREHALKRGNLSKHTTAIMHYAVRAKNYDLMNQAAPLLVGHSPAEMVRLIDDMNVVVSWLEYTEKWNKILQLALEYSEFRKVRRRKIAITSGEKVSTRSCSGCQNFEADKTTLFVLSKFHKGVKSLLNLGAIFSPSLSFCCSTCRDDIKMWRFVEEGIQKIPSFSSILQVSTTVPVEKN